MKSTATLALLDAWVQLAPRRSAEVARILADAGLDAGAIERSLAVRLAKPDPGWTTLPTFDPTVSRPLSPMLAQRMAYAGTIRDGFEKWLGPKDMQKAMRTRKVLASFEDLEAHWLNSAPARLRRDQLTLFALGDEPGSVTFLAWPHDAVDEPGVVRYHGQSERVFRNLNAFLKWATT